MAVHQVESIVRPTSIEEAWEQRRRELHASRFLAGGVDLVLYAPPGIGGHIPQFCGPLGGVVCTAGSSREIGMCPPITAATTDHAVR